MRCGASEGGSARKTWSGTPHTRFWFTLVLPIFGSARGDGGGGTSVISTFSLLLINRITVSQEDYGEVDEINQADNIGVEGRHARLFTIKERVVT